MIDVQIKGKVAIIDVREQALRKEHPGNEVLEYIKNAPANLTFEIHVPHEAKPLIKKLESRGMDVQQHKVQKDHYYIIASKDSISS